MGKHLITAIVRNKRGRILSIGRNSYVKTHPLMSKAAHAAGTHERIFLHAEVAALLQVNWEQAHSIEVFRYTKDGKPAMAKPCACCQYVINQTAIKVIWHT